MTLAKMVEKKQIEKVQKLMAEGVDKQQAADTVVRSTRIEGANETHTQEIIARLVEKL